MEVLWGRLRFVEFISRSQARLLGSTQESSDFSSFRLDSSYKC